MINSVSDPFPTVAFCRADAQTVKNGSSSHKIDYVAPTPVPVPGPVHVPVAFLRDSELRNKLVDYLRVCHPISLYIPIASANTSNIKIAAA